MNTKPKLIFTQRALPIILKAFGKSIDDDGLIIESSTGEPVLTPEGEEICAVDLAGLKKGSEIFITTNLFSIMQLAEGKYGK
jgi:hypothetical protein